MEEIIYKQIMKKREKIKETEKEIDILETIANRLENAQDELVKTSMEKQRLEKLLCEKGFNCESCVYFKKNEDFSADEIREMIRGYYTDRAQIAITKQTKKSEKTIDVKPLIYQFAPWAMEVAEPNTELDGCRGFFLQLCTGSTDNIKPELVLRDFYEFFGKAYDPFNLQIHRLEIYEQTGDGLRPLYQAGDRIVSRDGAAV